MHNYNVYNHFHLSIHYINNKFFEVSERFVTIIFKNIIIIFYNIINFKLLRKRYNFHKYINIYNGYLHNR